MKAVAWMVAGSLGSWAVIAPIVDEPTRIAALYGLLGPLLIAALSWAVIERVHRRRPAAVTNVMIAAFGLKLVFIGAYVSVMFALLSVRVVPFVVSFAVYFIALYVVEALLLRRLFAGLSGAAGSSLEM